MNKHELQKVLDEEGVYPYDYSLNGSLVHDGLILEKGGDEWYVFTLERGEKRSFKYFETEHLACVYIHDILVRYYRALPDELRKIRKEEVKTIRKNEANQSLNNNS